MSVNVYETVFIAEPEISNDQVDQLISKLKQAITANEGNVTGEDRWGRRRLAYPIQGHREGYYAVMNFTAGSGVVNALEHLYNVTDSVVRHLTVRVIKKNKTFRPRREKPAGHVEGARHGGPPRSGGYRGRTDGPRSSGPSAAPSTAAPATTPAPAATEAAAPATPAAVPAPSSEPTSGGTPA